MKKWDSNILLYVAIILNSISSENFKCQLNYMNFFKSDEENVDRQT